MPRGCRTTAPEGFLYLPDSRRPAALGSCKRGRGQQGHTGLWGLAAWGSAGESAAAACALPWPWLLLARQSHSAQRAT